MNVARGRPSKPPKTPAAVTAEPAVPFVPPPVLVPPQVFVVRPIYRCPHCGSANVLRDGDTPRTTARFRCTRCGTCPICETPGALVVGAAFHCKGCATRNGRPTAFPVAGNGTKFKLPVGRTVAPNE